MMGGWEVPLRELAIPWVVGASPGCLSHRGFSSRRQRKVELPGPRSGVRPPILEGLAYKEGITKNVAMKEMLIWYFLRHVTLMNTEREVKKPFQQVYR